MSYVKLEEHVTGSRNVAGTDHPVSNVLYRQQIGTRRPLWIVARNLCDGVPSRARSYSTLAAALRALVGE